MRIIAGILIILVVAFIGSRWSFTAVRLPGARGRVYLTGTEYLLVGLALGPLMLGLLDGPTIKGLTPLINLALGWIGLTLGVQLEWARVRGFPRQYLLLSALQGVGALVVVTLAIAQLGWVLPLPRFNTRLPWFLVLAATAVPTSPTFLALLQRQQAHRQSRLLEALRFVAGTDAVLGVAVFGLLVCLQRTDSLLGLAYLAPAQHMVLSVLLGLMLGLMLHRLTRLRCSKEELLLFVVGLVLFGAGAASYLRLSPLLVTLVAGLLLANVRGAKLRLNRALARLERPVGLAVLIVAGAMATFSNVSWPVALLLALPYCLFRVVGKLAGGRLGAALTSRATPLPRMVGLGLVSQGGVAAAMVVSFHAAGGHDAGLVLDIVVLSIAINELISPALARWLLGRQA